MNKRMITLNNQTFEFFKNTTFDEKRCQPWLMEIYRFLGEWFDEKQCVKLHTSGSTGIPKEIILKKEAMRNSALATNDFLGLNKNTTSMLCLPANYIAGKMMIVRAIVGEYNLIVIEPSSNPFYDIDNEIDFAAITPFQLHHSIDVLKRKRIKKIIVGGGKVDSVLDKKTAQLPIEFYETYGMTETASHIALRKMNGEDKSDVFTVLNDVFIDVDKHKRLIINSSKLLINKLLTNDVVDLIDNKHFRWIGRYDNVINSGGVKLFPEQIEKKLEEIITHPFFITSLPDEKLGWKVVLVIETIATSLDQNILSRIDDSLNKFEKPKNIFLLPKFVRSISNKILKTETLKCVKI